MALLLYGLLNRLLAFKLKKRSLLACSIASGILGIAYPLSPNDDIRLVLFCLQIACVALLIVSWGQRLSLCEYRSLIPLVCIGGLISIIGLAVFSLFTGTLALLIASLLPACSGICLYIMRRMRAEASSGENVSDLPVASKGDDSFEPIEIKALRNTPWVLLAMLCFCTFSASLFSGLATSPFLSNSGTVLRDSLTMSLVGTLIIGLGGCLFFRQPKRQGDTGDTAATDDTVGEPAKDPLFIIQLLTGVTLVLLLVGLLLFSMKLPGTMTAALGMVIAARYCLVILCWILFPRALADAHLPFLPCFTLLILANGTLYAPFLGTWIKKSLALGFDALTGIASVLIALIALFAILYMIIRMRQISAKQQLAQLASAAPEQLTMEDIRNALHEHQLKIMEPYNLTEREQEVISMIVDGQTMGGIADELFISERTVKFHSKNAYDKLGVRSKKELMKMFSDLE